MEQLRETRAQIDPELLKHVREAIYASPLTDTSLLDEPVSSDMPDKVPVDRAHILAVAVKYLELCPDNAALQKEIKSYLAE